MKIARYEFKFYINQFTYHILRNRLKYVMNQDVYSIDNTWYLIRSIYFDSYHDVCYAQKLSWDIERKKYRLRRYNDNTELIKFEIKEKVKNTIKKHSYLIDYQHADEMLNNNYTWLLKHPDSMLQLLYTEFTTQLYRPKVLIDYVREAYTLPHNNIRITFDKELSSASDIQWFRKNNVIPNQQCMEQELMILEVKYNNTLPNHLHHILNTSGVYQRSAISKYIMWREPYYPMTRSV